MAKKRMTVLQKLLDFSGINPERLRIRWISSAEAAEFVHEISEFVEGIKKAGPNPLKVRKATYYDNDKVKVKVEAESD